MKHRTARREKLIRHLLVQARDEKQPGPVTTKAFNELHSMARSIMFGDSKRFFEAFPDPDEIAMEATGDMFMRIMSKDFDLRDNFPIIAYIKTIYNNRAAGVSKQPHHVSLDELEEGFLDNLFQYVEDPDDIEDVKVAQLMSILCRVYTPNEIRRFLPSCITIITKETPFSSLTEARLKKFYILFEATVRHIKGIYRMDRIMIRPGTIDEQLKSLITVQIMENVLKEVVDTQLLGTVDFTTLMRLARMYGGETVHIPRYSELREIMLRSAAISRYLFEDESTLQAAKDSVFKDFGEDDHSHSLGLSKPISHHLTQAISNLPISQMVSQYVETINKELDRAMANMSKSSGQTDRAALLEFVNGMLKLSHKMEGSLARMMRERIQAIFDTAKKEGA